MRLVAVAFGGGTTIVADRVIVLLAALTLIALRGIAESARVAAANG